MRSPEYPDLTWMPPRQWESGRNGLPGPRVAVIHTTEGGEGATAAEDGAAYDGRRTDGTSAHYFVDPDSIVQLVRTPDTAYSALWHGNQIGIHYELCGRAGQTVAQWHDADSAAILRLAAAQVARDCRKWGIPAVRLTPAQVRAGAKGICGHVDITGAYPEDHGDHTDPGPNFPWPEFLGYVQSALNGDGPVTPAEMDQIAAKVKTAVLGDGGVQNLLQRVGGLVRMTNVSLVGDKDGDGKPDVEANALAAALRQMGTPVLTDVQLAGIAAQVAPVVAKAVLDGMAGRLAQ